MKCLFFLFVIPLVSADRIVTTNNGPIGGVSVAGKTVEAFLGIPYAEPPVGELRFARPVPKSPWKETYIANQLPSSCMQVNLGALMAKYYGVCYYGPHPESTFSEDCLYLNLWVPERKSEQKPKPIMVWFHGGGFMVGSTNMTLYDGSVLADHGDVIVATVNYRLGTLGFFSGFTDEAQGNMGIYDQVMAIQWIKDNANHFGGDPDNIILFGESAGSFSVSLHMISPLSKHLFRRGIMQSGTAYHPQYSDDNRILRMCSQTAASVLGCTSEVASLKEDPERVIDCMKRLPAEKFAEADYIVMGTYGWFIPRTGDDFLPENPINLFQKGMFENKSVLLGTMKDEGSLILTTRRSDLLGLFGEKGESALFNDTLIEEIVKAITKVAESDSYVFQSYIDRVKDERGYTYLDAMIDIIGDFYFTCNTIFQADYMTLKNIPVYFYQFEHRPISTPLAEWMGATHFEEVQFVFGNPMYKEFTEFEEELSKDIMDMWTTFAKTGNPNIPGSLKWPRYTFKDPKYFVIGKTDRIGMRPDNYRCEVWKQLFRYGIDTKEA